jgi:hypothetical protein
MPLWDCQFMPNRPNQQRATPSTERGASPVGGRINPRNPDWLSFGPGPHAGEPACYEQRPLKRAEISLFQGASRAARSP